MSIAFEEDQEQLQRGGEGRSGRGVQGGHLVIPEASFQRRHLQHKPDNCCQCFASEQSLAEVHFHFSRLFNLTVLNILFVKKSQF